MNAVLRLSKLFLQASGSGCIDKYRGFTYGTRISTHSILKNAFFRIINTQTTSYRCPDFYFKPVRTLRIRNFNLKNSLPDTLKHTPKGTLFLFTTYTATTNRKNEKTWTGFTIRKTQPFVNMISTSPILFIFLCFRVLIRAENTSTL